MVNYRNLVKSMAAFIVLNVVVGCAGFNQKSNTVKIPLADEKKDIEARFGNVEAGLEKITDDAIAQGDQAVEYLSGDLFLKGSDASVRGDSKSAALIFKYVYKLRPNDRYIAKRYSVELIRSNDLVASKIILEKLYKENQKDTTVSLVLAGVYAALDESAKSQKIYKKILSFDKRNEEACIFLAKSYALQKKYKTSMKTIKKCEKYSKKAIFSHYKGKIAVTEKKFDLAAKYFREALSRDPDYYQSVNALGIYYEEKGQVKKAKRVYLRYLKNNPNSYSVLARVVNLLFQEGEMSEVIPYAERLSNIDPSDLNLKVRLGILYTDNGRYEDAKGMFREILVSVPDSDKVLYYLGSLYQQTKEYENSLEYFGKIKSDSSLYVDSSLQVAQILNLMAQSRGHEDKHHINRFKLFVKERSQFNKSLDVELKVMLAGYYENNSQLIEAINTVESVKSHEEFNEDHDYYLAALYEKNKQFDQSRVIIEKMLVENPDNPHALNFLGYSLLERGIELDKAYTLISRAVKLKPNDGYIRDSLGWFYYKTGNISKAYKEIKKAHKLVKTDSVIAKHLAMVYKEMKKYDQAKKFYVEALKNCKRESEKAEVVKALEDIENLRLPASIED